MARIDANTIYNLRFPMRAFTKERTAITMYPSVSTAMMVCTTMAASRADPDGRQCLCNPVMIALVTLATYGTRTTRPSFLDKGLDASGNPPLSGLEALIPVYANGSRTSRDSNFRKSRSFEYSVRTPF